MPWLMTTGCMHISRLSLLSGTILTTQFGGKLLSANSGNTLLGLPEGGLSAAGGDGAARVGVLPLLRLLGPDSESVSRFRPRKVNWLTASLRRLAASMSSRTGQLSPWRRQ
jgi:hypothetical protein